MTLNNLKNTLLKRKFEIIFLILGIAFLSIFLLLIFHYFRENCQSHELWLSYNILVILVQLSIWRRLAQWMRSNRNRIYYKMLEFLFFIFIFISSYLMCLLVNEDFPLGIISLFFLFSIISAAYCGWLFFLEGISDYRRPQMKKLVRTYIVKKRRDFDERMFILGFHIFFLPTVLILLYFDFNHDFLKLFSLPILSLTLLYDIIYYPTRGDYYKYKRKWIKTISLIGIGILIGGIFGFIITSPDSKIINFIELFF